MLRPTHASPYVRKVDVHEECVPAPSFRWGTNTELLDQPSLSILSPAVRVPRISNGSLRGTGEKSASPRVRVVHDSIAADVGFWDDATVTPFSDDSDLASGDASKRKQSGLEGASLPDNQRLPGLAQIKTEQVN